MGVGLVATIALFILWNIASYPYQSVSSSRRLREPTEAPILTKVPMLYGKPNLLYERALQTHQEHCDRWNCKMLVLREELSPCFWNKPNHLISIILQELAKPADERLQWLM